MSWHDNYRYNAYFFHPEENNLEDLENRYRTRTGIIVGAGPSLDKNINHLKKLNKEAIIIATDAACRALSLNKIEPHYVICAEEDPIIFRFLDDVNFKQSHLICSTTAHPKFIDSFPGTLSFYNNRSEQLEERFSDLAKEDMRSSCYRWPPLVPDLTPAPNVAFHAIRAAEYMGIKYIALIGCDFEVKDYKRHHCKDFPEGARSEKWLTDKIACDRMNERFIQVMDEVREKKFWPMVVNCTEGGKLDTFMRMDLDIFLSVFGCWEPGYLHKKGER